MLVLGRRAGLVGSCSAQYGVRDGAERAETGAGVRRRGPGHGHVLLDESPGTGDELLAGPHRRHEVERITRSAARVQGRGDEGGIRPKESTELGRPTASSTWAPKSRLLSNFTFWPAPTPPKCTTSAA